ncbi:hypothetical protein DBZ36_07430 [Alginatibacterium sediminis]|uniref:GP-PDE domain-containing protein n=2 Tax=Alginatibacterium sediminis TaxID=2164068 RepID=A0A420EIK2_9ALTE|nr:hypothetical protein DBZ36_07430 [Alginatibacterium sediminis]
MLHRLRSSGLQMFACFLIINISLAAVFVPFDLWLTTTLMRWQGVDAFANQEIFGFILSPLGFLLSVWLLTQISFSFFVEHSVITILLAKHDVGKKSVIETLQLILARSWRVAKIVLFQSIGVGVLLVSLVWAGRWVYGLMLADWDINYYLSQDINTVWMAFALLILVTLPITVFVLRYWASWWLALPMSLLQDCSQWQLFQQARRISRDIYSYIFWGHIVWLTSRTAIFALLAATLFVVFRPVLEWSLNSEDLQYWWLVLAASIVGVIGVLLTFADRFIYAACQYYLLRLQVKRHRFVSTEQRLVAVQERQTRRRPLIWAFICAIVVVGFYNAFHSVNALVEHLQQGSHGQITAHRAGGFLAVENSEAGLKKSIELGIGAAEIDVQITSDAQVILFHDRDLRRLALDPIIVEESTYSEITAVYQQQGLASPPLLSDMLELYSDSIEFNIELKRYNTSLALSGAVAEIVKTIDSAVIISSLDTVLLQAVMDEFKEQRPTNLRFALIYAASVGSASIERDVDILMVSQQWLSAWKLLEVQQREQEVHVWTINNASEMERLLLLGVDGIITDEPITGLAVKQSIKDLDLSERLTRSLRHWLSF